MKKRPTALMFAIILTAALLIAGCDDTDEPDLAGKVSQQINTTADAANESGAEEDEEEEPGLVEHVISEEALTGEGAKQFFIGEPFYDGKVNNEDDAVELMSEVIEFIGGDDSTYLELAAIDGPNDEGNTFYTFRQLADDIEVYGASVKLVTDKDHNAIGLNSTIVPNLNVSGDVKWSVDAKEAEEIVKNELKSEDISTKIFPGVTEQTLLPIDDLQDRYVYVWVVYTRNYYDDVDAAYIAHYVSSEGEYLYCNPVYSPGNTDALSGSVATFSFSGMTGETWTQTVRRSDGKKEEITVPVARDSETGLLVLADPDRHIICADYSELTYNDTLDYRTKGDTFDDNELLIYSSFIEIYDFFDSIGWPGADGSSSPILLLMGYVDDDGLPGENAAYMGKLGGFDTFIFDSTQPYGESVDVIAHEFTHAFTASAMLTNLYMNDYGAINEAMSDIFGNIVESYLGRTTDKTWLIGENGVGAIRCMSDPHRFEQPAFVWDKFYVPAVLEPDENNDNGGVHINSSLLNLIAYKLNAAGMDEVDQLEFWRDVAFTLTPRTDYEQIAEILPWALKMCGQEKYMDVLKTAIEETGIADGTLPLDVPKNLARFQMIFPDHDILEAYSVQMQAYDIEKDVEYLSWAQDKTDLVALTVEPGYYFFHITITDRDTGESIIMIKDRSGWAVFDEEEYTEDSYTDDMVLVIEKGQIMAFDSGELSEYFE